MKENKGRIFGYDALKALAAFFVVLYHVGMVDMGYREGEYYYPTLVQVLWLFCACGVPLFFMVNGALTVHRNYNLKKSAKKAGRLVLAGAFWGIVVMCIYAASNHDMSSFCVGRLTYYWFLFSLALMYVVNYVINRLPLWCRYVIIALLLIFPFVTNLVWDVILLVTPSINLPKWGHAGAFTLYGLVYLYVGDYLSRRPINKWLTFVVAVVGLLLLSMEATAVANYKHAQFEGGNYCFPTIGALLLSLAVFSRLKDWDIKESLFKRFVVFLGNNALGIYIFHLILMIVVGFLRPQLSAINLHPITAVAVTLVLTVLSAMISEGLRRSPLSFSLKL
jgi:surface polysaccharide O-acyltransferase-like enzyme